MIYIGRLFWLGNQIRPRLAATECSVLLCCLNTTSFLLCVRRNTRIICCVLRSDMQVPHANACMCVCAESLNRCC